MLAGLMQVRQVVETLRCCSHQAFPVTPDVKKAFDSAEPFELHGTILRHTVLHLLQHRIGFFDPLQADIPPSRSHIPSTQMVRTARPPSRMATQSRESPQDASQTVHPLRARSERPLRMHAQTSVDAGGASQGMLACRPG